MSEPVRKYLRRVRRRLCASPATKQRLLAGLVDELGACGETGYDGLVRAFGSPEAAAAELQSSVDEGEAAGARARTKRLAIVLAVVAALLAAALVFYFWYVTSGMPVRVVREEVVEITDYPLNSSELPLEESE